MKTFLSTISLLSLLLIPTQTALAASFMGEEMIFMESPINDDMYAAGGKVIFDSAVDGDLIVGGGDVTINGPISQDIIAAGGEVRIRGQVGDDIRVGGGDIQIDSNVADDVIAFGGRIEIHSDATIGGDLVVNGGEVTVNGDVLGNVIINAGVAYVNGTVEGDFTMHGGKLFVSGIVGGNAILVAENITVDSGTEFQSNVNYWSNDEVDLTAVTAGTVTLDEELKPYKDKHVREAKVGLAAALGALATGALLYSLLSALLVISLLVWATKTYFGDSAKIMRKEPGMNMFYGMLYFVATPIFALLLLITLIGIPIGATVFALYVITIVFAKPFTAVVLAKYWEQNKRLKIAGPKWKTIAYAILAYIALSLIGLVPVIGWLVVFVTICTAFGAMMRAEYQRFLKVR